MYLWVPAAEMSVGRVKRRVQLGGHHVPDDTIRRRYEAGLRNFFELYSPLAEEWRFYDNSQGEEPAIVAYGIGMRTRKVALVPLWRHIRKQYS